MNLRPGEIPVTPILITIVVVPIAAAACAQNPTPWNASEPEPLWAGLEDAA